MTNIKSTKRALGSSVLALFLCFAMLLGTTFAWFTDSVTSANNIITAGNLDVELYYQVEGQKDWTKVTDTTNIFKEDTLWEPGHTEVVKLKVVNEGTLALQYKLGVNVAKEVGGVGAEGPFMLSDYIKYGIVGGAQTYTREEAIAAVDATANSLKTAFTSEVAVLEKDEEAFVTMVVYMPTSVGNEANYSEGVAPHIELGINVLATQVSAEEDSFDDKYDAEATYPVVSTPVQLPTTPVTEATTITAGTDDKGVAVNVPANALNTIVNKLGTEVTSIALAHSEPRVEGNAIIFDSIDIVDQNGKPIDLANIENTAAITVTLPAQKTFTAGTTIVVYHDGVAVASATVADDGTISYDVTHFCEVQVSNVDEITNEYELAAALKNGGEYTISNDIGVNNTLEVPEAAKVTLDLNGKTITGTMHKNVGAVIKNEGNLVIKNGTISSTANNGGSAIMNKGTLTVENVTLNGAPNADGSWPSYAVNNTGVMTVKNSKITSYHGAVASYGEGALVTLNNSEIAMTGIPGFTSHGIYTYNAGKVIVNGGTYANNATDQNASGASVINGKVEINGGTFTGRIENYYGTPSIKGGTFSVKPNAKFIAEDYKVVENNGKYDVVVDTDNVAVVTNVEELTAAIAKGGKILLANDVDVADTKFIIANGKTVTVNLNGYKIYGTSAKTGNVEMFLVKGNLTVKNGTVTLAVTENQGWNAMATIFDVTAGGVLNMEGVTAKVGGTDMNFIVHLNNWGTATAVINNCKFDLSYVAVRAFNSGYNMNTVTIKNTEVTGGARLFWVHNYTAEGKDDSTLTLDIYGNNNTSTNAKPIRFGFDNSIYFDTNGNRIVGTADELVEALENGYNVVFANDIKIDPANMSNAYGKTGINVKEGQTLDGNGYTLDVQGAGGTWDSGICAAGGCTIKNIKVTGSFRGIFIRDGENKVVLENVTTENTVYTISIDQASGQGLEATNCTFNGWTSFAATIGNVKFTNCKFGAGSGYNYSRPYAPTEYVGCTFAEGHTMDPRAAVTFENCTIGGVDLTAENLSTLVTDTAKATIK